MALIAAIVVVTNTSLVSVTQRTHEIGIRRALGATRAAIIGETLAEAAIVGLLGGTVGLLAAAGLLAVVARGGDRRSDQRANRGRQPGRGDPERGRRRLVSGPSGGVGGRRRGAETRVMAAPQLSRWARMVGEPAWLAFDSLRTSRARSFLAIGGIVIGIVTVVLVAAVLANVRNQVALLFRDLGTENVFAFHLTGDP